ncbi:MAG: dolichyl-phosphate beta-glucosyltransferase [Chloroflexota bacterium]
MFPGPQSGPHEEVLTIAGSNSPFLSLIVPAYNEESRLPDSLAKIVSYLRKQDYEWEVVVANDGSEDGTAAVAERFAALDGRVRLLNLKHLGKAAAVRGGILKARGELVFICDADLSMPIEEVAKFLPAFAQGYDIAIGSREAVGAKRYGEPFYRHLMGRVFNRLVRLLTVGGFQDTQCGFKCLRAVVARDLFNRMRLYSDDGRPIKGPMVTGFDVELLFLALRSGYRVAEIPIDWYYAKGSKVNPVQDTFRMFGDVVKVRINDLRGQYNHRQPTL